MGARETAALGLATAAARNGVPLAYGAEQVSINAIVASGRPVLITQFHTLTSVLTIPAGAHIIGINPAVAGFDAAMATGLALSLGDDVVMENITLKSTAYPYTAIANTAAWDLWSRSIRAGNRNRFYNLYIQDVAGGLDFDTADGGFVEGLYCKQLHSRYGWASCLHVDAGRNINGVSIYGTDCDRFIEPEDGSQNCTFVGGKALRIYPPGYTGNPADGTGDTDYNTGSFVLSAHSHQGLGACRGIHYRDFELELTLSGVRFERSGGANLSDYPVGCTAKNITIRSPARVNRTATGGGANIVFNPVHLNALNSDVEVQFCGTMNTQLSRLVLTTGADAYGNEVKVNVEPGCYSGRAVEFAAPYSTLKDGWFIGVQGGSAATSLIRVSASGGAIMRGTAYQPKFHSAVYDFASGITNCRRQNTTYVPPTSNAPTAVVADASTSLTSTNNIDA